MEPNIVCGSQLAQDRAEAWDLHFTEAYSDNDQRALFTKSLVTFLGTLAGWQLLSSHMSLVGNELTVCLDMEGLLARQEIPPCMQSARLGSNSAVLLLRGTVHVLSHVQVPRYGSDTGVG